MRVLLVILVLMFSGQLFAGNTLYLKSGKIEPSMAKIGRSIPGHIFTKEISYYILQFKQPVTEEEKTELRQEGLKFFRYIPDDAFVIRGDFHSLERLKKKYHYISNFVPFIADYKMSEGLKVQSIFTSQNNLVLLVRAFDKDVVDEVNRQVSLLPNTRSQKKGRYLTVEIPASEIWNLAQLQGVEWIESFPQVKSFILNDLPWAAETVSEKVIGDYTDLNGYESGTRLMGFEEAWDRSFDGSGQMVGVADTGFDTGDIDKIHPDFEGRIYSGYHFGLWATSWEDPMGHGTHVAGSIVGTGEASDGLIRGGAYGAQLVVQGMWSPTMKSLSVPPDLTELFDPAYSDGARIHTNSWGSPMNLGAYDEMAVQVDEYVWNNPDMLLLFAAGNSGVDLDADGRVDGGSVSSPGTAKNILTVGASENFVELGGLQLPVGLFPDTEEIWGAEPIASDRMSDNPNGIAVFSSRGPALDGRIKPDVVAPGTNILSIRSSHETASPLWGEYNKSYVYSGGTSMSTPLVAGAAAVLRQYLAEEEGVDEPSAALMKALLMHTASDLFPGQFGEGGEEAGQEMLTPRPNNEEGFGLVDVDRLTSLSNTYFADDRHGVRQGADAEYELTLEEGSSLQVTLVYTDAPGAPNASRALVNDLDLELVAPNGIRVEAKDRLNNFENLEFSEAPEGRYLIYVKGYRVPQGRDGRQPYSLVITGSMVE